MANDDMFIGKAHADASFDENFNTSKKIFPYPKYKYNQKEIIENIMNLDPSGVMMLEEDTGRGKTVASLVGLLKRKKEGQKIIVFVKTINQINPVLREWQLIAARMSQIPLVLPLLGKSRTCGLQFPTDKNTIIDCRSRSFRNKPYWKRNKLLERLIRKNKRYRLLKWLNLRLLKSKPTVPDFKSILSTRVNCPYYNSLSVLVQADIIITTYGYMKRKQFPRIKKFLGIENKDLLVLIDEAHNLVFIGMNSLHKLYLELFTLFFKKTWFLSQLKSEIRGLRFLKLDSIFTKQEWNDGIAETKELIGRVWRYLEQNDITEVLSNNYRSISSFEDLSDLLQKMIEEMKSFFHSIGSGRIVVSQDQISSLEKQPHELLQQFENAYLLVLQSATFTPLSCFRDIFQLDQSTTVLCDFMERNIREILQKSNEFRASYISAITSTSRFRNDMMFERFTQIINEIFERCPSHVMVLCPSYEFATLLTKMIRKQIETIPLLLETPESTTKELTDGVFQLKEKGIIIGNQHGKMLEGNEWVINGSSIVNTIVFAGLSSRVPMQENELIDKLRVQLLGDEKIAQLFAYQIPLYIRAKQALGRTRRSGSDRGAIIILDNRADDFLQRMLCLSRYWELDVLLDDLYHFYQEKI